MTATIACEEKGWLTWMNQRPRLFLWLSALVLATQTSTMWYASPDGTCYLSLAKSFARGESLTMLGNSSIYVAPFYSFAISPLFLAGDRPFLWLSLFEWSAAVSLICGVYRWANRACPRIAVLVTCMTALNHSVWFYYRRTLKETVCMVLTIWTINFMHDLLDSRSGAVKTAILVFATSCFMVMLTLTRYVGLVFPIGFAACLLIQALRQRKGYLRAAALIACVSLSSAGALYAWVTQNMNYQTEGHIAAALAPYRQETAGSGGIRDSQPSSIRDRVQWNLLLDGLRLRLSDVGHLLIPGLWKTPSLDFERKHLVLGMIYLATAVACGLGWWHLTRQRLDVLVYSIPLWVAVYLHSSAEVQGRVFNPLLPALCLCLWQGLQTFCRFRTAALCMAVLFLGNVAQSTGYWLLIDRPRAVEAQREWPVVERLAEFLRENRQPVAISNRVEHAVWLMLQLTLDREIQHPLTRRIGQPEPQWFVALRSEPIVKDGEPRFFAGDYAVFALPQSRVAQLPSAQR